MTDHGCRAPARLTSGWVMCLVVAGAMATRADAATRAGVAVVDATWHVGAAAGQYAGDPLVDEQDPLAVLFGSHGWDPFYHHLRRDPAYGIQSRLTIRALVVEGPDGTRIALVKNDLYIPQDILWRRAAQILEGGSSGIDRGHFTMMASHNHNSPFYSSTSWGPWLFQDSFDARFFEYYAQKMAAAVESAAASLVPVRVGAAFSHFDKTHRHAFGPTLADDGTPAGYPRDDNDHEMMVVRFDDVTDTANPKPIAILANFGLHPEFLEGNNLTSADYLGPLERMVDRATGARLVWSQGSVGTAEPERSDAHSVNERLEFSHRDYAQAERGARLMADRLIETWRDVERPESERQVALRVVPSAQDLPVAMVGRMFPGPLSHPYPGVSNCRTDKTIGGRPQFPVFGLPDCTEDPGDTQAVGEVVSAIPATGLTTDDLESRGVPVPENYSFPSYTGLEETLGVHLQAARIGEVLLTMCPCEQWADQTRNVKSRTDRVAGNIWRGYDWSAQCVQSLDTTWTCPDPRNTVQTLPPIADALYQRMRAQVQNDAAGWNDPGYAAWAESEPTDPSAIKGNYTHTELSAAEGYGMTMTIGMTNDYVGYIATYREYQRGDHYRKALTGFGAHSSDYIATRLVEFGRELRGGPPAGDVSDQLLAPKTAVDEASADARAVALGAAVDVALPVYEASLPSDGGTARVTREPEDIERFSAAFFSWIGGSNWTDDPDVRIERQAGTDPGTGDPLWTTFADMSGEVVVTLELPPDLPSGAVPWATGSSEWQWTAHFEAFDSDLADLGARPGQTPAGAYRFVVDGFRREAGSRVPYRFESRPFAVRPWSGITVQNVRVDGDGRVSFLVGPRTSLTAAQVDAGGCKQNPQPIVIGPIDYPDSYDELPLAAPFIRHSRSCRQEPQGYEWFCFTCSFRPWADTGEVASATVTILPAGGGMTEALATLDDDGRWRTAAALSPGDRARVEPGGVVDANGEINGEGSAEVTRP